MNRKLTWRGQSKNFDRLMLKMRQKDLARIQDAEIKFKQSQKERLLDKWYNDHLPFGGIISKIAQNVPIFMFNFKIDDAPRIPKF